ncbi:hypothetical protein PG991_009013 [Apiospora marii]|uniref:Heavy metal tolerance protein n=1 Tax=Apiospora marii TaxID=335849 RepID=A0ABR1RJG1_9PEZI
MAITDPPGRWLDAYPILLCVVYMTTRLISTWRRDRKTQIKPQAFAHRHVAHLLHAFLCLSLAATAAILCWTVAKGLESPVAWWSSTQYLSSILGVCAFHTAGILPDADGPYSPAVWNANAWLVSFAFELSLAALQVRAISSIPHGSTGFEAAQLCLSVGRTVVLATMLMVFWVPRVLRWGSPDGSGETERLIPSGSNTMPSAYGTAKDNLVNGAATSQSYDAQHTEWTDYVSGFSKLFPFLWPSTSRPLQFRALFCFGLLVLQRIVNILVPHQLGIVVSEMGPGEIPHLQILLYVLLRGLQGQQGVIGSIRALLWIPISQLTYRQLTAASFEHVLMLSLDFHLKKRLGEVTSALSKGSALNTFLDGFAFQLFPMVVDLWISAVYFMVEFDFFHALVVICVTWTYLYVTIYMAKYRGRARREMTNRERAMEAAKTDALISYETVHHNGAIGAEMTRFRKLMAFFQGAEYKVFFSLNLLNAVQNIVFTIGILILCYLDAFQISQSRQKVARFVTLLTYLAQLQAPLSFFGSFYTQVQNNLVDAERMLDWQFDEQPTIVDKPGSKPLVRCQGHIRFQDVDFAYDARKPALRGVSFEVAPGTATAIVGESGSGKSTILKLLFRFYDVDKGSIKIDAVDSRDITVEDLRRHFGIVPQDTVLFNDTLMYNIMYAKPEATEEEVYAACRAANIHDKILSFPEGYETSVGERGLKLSGGEKQRVSIARTFLRSPQILLLDEATASLDSQTERQIQEALELVSKGRTTITIAHRLSTIIKSDQIVVLHEGRVVEKGTHAQLIAQQGKYLEMWNKQIQADEDEINI